MSSLGIDSLIIECLPQSWKRSKCLRLSGTTLTDTGNPSTVLFAKTSSNVAQLVGEHTSLRAIRMTNRDLVSTLYPLSFNLDGSKAGMVTEKFELDRAGSSERQRELGLAVAKMHRSTDEVDVDPQDRGVLPKGYGFSVPTYCGVTEQENEWAETWEEFYRERRLGSLVRRLKDPKIDGLWELLQTQAIPLLLRDVVPAPKPVILHGDLWSGNVGWANDKPIVFDPSSYYGHNEADLGITYMFGGFSADFYQAYHSVHPRSDMHYEERIQLYELFHHLNHALMFGGSYRSSALRIMQELVHWGEDVNVA